MELKDGFPRTGDQQKRGPVCEADHYNTLHEQEYSANSAPPVTGPRTSKLLGQALFQEGGQLPPVPDECSVRGGGEKDLITFTQDWDRQKDGSAVILFPVLRKGGFTCGLPFPEHNIVKSFTDSVQLRESGGHFKYVLKREKWAEASSRSLEKEIRLGHSFEGVCKVLGIAKKVENGEDFISFLLEYCAGQTLEQRRKQADWDIESAQCAFQMILKIVSQLEGRGLMITDLKPRNFCFRSEDPRSICLVDLESIVDLTGNRMTYRYTAQFSPPFHLDLGSTPDIKTQQMMKWHRWSMGVIIACCLPPFSKPWQEEWQSCCGDPSRLHEKIIKHPKGIMKYLPFRRPQSDQWIHKNFYQQLMLCMGGLLGLDPPLTIKDCLDFTIFTDADKVQLEMTISGKCLGGIQVEPGTTMDKLIQLSEFKALVPSWRSGYQLMVSGRMLCPTTACFFRNDKLTICPPPQVVLTLKDGRTMTELGKIQMDRGSSLKQMLRTRECREVMEGWNEGGSFRLKNSQNINIFKAHFFRSEVLTVWPPI